MVMAVEKFSFYLLGNHFIIESNHQLLSYLKTNSKSKDELSRWELMLRNFDFHIKYIKGSDNHMSDCLSQIVQNYNFLPNFHISFLKQVFSCINII